MTFAEYLAHVPKSLEERRIENCKQYRREKNNEYKKKMKARKALEKQEKQNVSI
jgi:hypothetical protein